VTHHSYRVQLLALAAECERHSNLIITADDHYKEAAELILAGPRPISQKYSKILLEAATVAKFRSQTEPQLRRAIKYLEAITDVEFAPLRILGMLVEFSARVGDENSYRHYRERVQARREDNTGRFSVNQLHALDEALDRADSVMNGAV
jgi:hypothetical protein